MFQPTKQPLKKITVDKVLIGGIDSALCLICGFLCLFALLTHASSLNLMIFQRRPVSSFQNEPIKQQRCWHTGRHMRGRINYVPENVYMQGRSSAKLEEKKRTEPWPCWWMSVVQIYNWASLLSTPPPSNWGLRQANNMRSSSRSNHPTWHDGRTIEWLRSNWKIASSVLCEPAESFKTRLWPTNYEKSWLSSFGSLC